MTRIRAWFLRAYLRQVMRVIIADRRLAALRSDERKGQA